MCSTSILVDQSYFTEISLFIHHCLFLMPPQRFLAWLGSDSICEYPQVLQTNHQIYSETLSVLH